MQPDLLDGAAAGAPDGGVGALQAGGVRGGAAPCYGPGPLVAVRRYDSRLHGAGLEAAELLGHPGHRRLLVVKVALGTLGQSEEEARAHNHIKIDVVAPLVRSPTLVISTHSVHS